jgi:hypothetical protein
MKTRTKIASAGNKTMIHKSIFMVATAAIMSTALISTQLSAQASVNPAPVQNNLSNTNFNLALVVMDLELERSLLLHQKQPRCWLFGVSRVLQRKSAEASKQLVRNLAEAYAGQTE